MNDVIIEKMKQEVLNLQTVIKEDLEKIKTNEMYINQIKENTSSAQKLINSYNKAITILEGNFSF